MSFKIKLVLYSFRAEKFHTHRAKFALRCTLIARHILQERIQGKNAFSSVITFLLDNSGQTLRETGW
jgi:hypothetical protein